jgi:hypothetical protein
MGRAALLDLRRSGILGPMRYALLDERTPLVNDKTAPVDDRTMLVDLRGLY